MDILSQLYHAAIIDEDGDLVGRVDSIHLLGGRMVIMLATISDTEAEEPDPGSKEDIPEDVEVDDGGSQDVDKIMHLREVVGGSQG